MARKEDSETQNDRKYILHLTMAAQGPRLKVYELYNTKALNVTGQIDIESSDLAHDPEALLTSAEWDFVVRSTDQINQLLRLNVTKEQLERKLTELNDEAIILDRIQFKLQQFGKGKLKSLFGKDQQFRICLEHKVIEELPASPFHALLNQALTAPESGLSNLRTSHHSSNTSLDIGTHAVGQLTLSPNAPEGPGNYDNHWLGVCTVQRAVPTTQCLVQSC